MNITNRDFKQLNAGINHMRYIRSDYFRVRSYEMDVHGNVSIQTICNYLQEIAGLHAAELGVSVIDLMKKNMTWVLSRLHVMLQKYPRWGEEIKIETWPSGAEGLYAIRDFVITATDKTPVGKATSSWMIIDLSRQKPIQMPDFVHELRVNNRPRAIDDPFDKMPKISKVDYEAQFNVRRSDLDINQHVNNVNYIEWAVESVPHERFRQMKLSELEINFRMESKYGDRVIAQTEVQEASCLHKLIRSGDNRELALAKTKWI